jgi:hypothetical protein
LAKKRQTVFESARSAPQKSEIPRETLEMEKDLGVVLPEDISGKRYPEAWSFSITILEITFIERFY